MVSTFSQLTLILRDIPRSLEQTARDPVTSRETDYYRANIEQVKSIDDFINDDRLFAYALQAHGLAEMTFAKALIRQVLEEGIDDPKSFANRLTDRRYRDLAETFNFARLGELTTTFERTRSGVTDRFLRQTLEEEAGADNQAIQLALYFQRRAGEIENTFDILGDRALLEVTRTALGLPLQLSSLDLDRQVELIEERLNIEDLKNPQSLDEFLQRFSVLYDLQNGAPPSNASAPPLLAGGIVNIDQSTILSIQNLKIGGR